MFNPQKNVNYVDICSYNTDFKQQTTSGVEYAQGLKNVHKEFSRHEVISKDEYVKLYFKILVKEFNAKDIDVLTKMHDLVHKIIKDMKQFFNKSMNHDIGDYIITYNYPADFETNKKHQVLTYHLVFYQTVSKPSVVLNFVNKFIEEYPDYSKHFDTSIYETNLFQSMHNVVIESDTNTLSKEESNYHRFIYHADTQLNFEHSIITYIPEPDKCTLINENGVCKQEIHQQEVVKQEANKQEATNTPEADKQETNTQETDKQETNKQETNTQEANTQEYKQFLADQVLESNLYKICEKNFNKIEVNVKGESQHVCFEQIFQYFELRMLPVFFQHIPMHVKIVADFINTVVSNTQMTFESIEDAHALIKNYLTQDKSLMPRKLAFLNIVRYCSEELQDMFEEKYDPVKHTNRIAYVDSIVDSILEKIRY